MESFTKKELEIGLRVMEYCKGALTSVNNKSVNNAIILVQDWIKNKGDEESKEEIPQSKSFGSKGVSLHPDDIIRKQLGISSEEFRSKKGNLSEYTEAELNSLAKNISRGMTYLINIKESVNLQTLHERFTEFIEDRNEELLFNAALNWYKGAYFRNAIKSVDHFSDVVTKYLNCDDYGNGGLKYLKA